MSSKKLLCCQCEQFFGVACEIVIRCASENTSGDNSLMLVASLDSSQVILYRFEDDTSTPVMIDSPMSLSVNTAAVCHAGAHQTMMHLTEKKALAGVSFSHIASHTNSSNVFTYLTSDGTLVSSRYELSSLTNDKQELELSSLTNDNQESELSSLTNDNQELELSSLTNDNQESDFVKRISIKDCCGQYPSWLTNSSMRCFNQLDVTDIRSSLLVPLQPTVVNNNKKPYITPESVLQLLSQNSQFVTLVQTPRTLYYIGQWLRHKHSVILDTQLLYTSLQLFTPVLYKLGSRRPHKITNPHILPCGCSSDSVVPCGSDVCLLPHSLLYCVNEKGVHLQLPSIAVTGEQTGMDFTLDYELLTQSLNNSDVLEKEELFPAPSDTLINSLSEQWAQWESS